MHKWGEKMDNRQIGVFDSGLGGLTCVKQLMREMPGEDIVYFGDTARVPYGSRSEQTIIDYTRDDINFLLGHNTKCIIAACGTASSVALPKLEGDFGVPVLSIVPAAAKAAAKATKNGKIGVIGTAGTIRSGLYERHLKVLNPGVETLCVACPLFVPLVEEGFANTQAARLVAEQYLAPLVAFGADTLILGCTHYPLLEKTISAVVGEDVALINTGAEAAKYVRQLLEKENKIAEKASGGKVAFYVSDDPHNFGELASRFLEREMEYMVKQVRL